MTWRSSAALMNPLPSLSNTLAGGAYASNLSLEKLPSSPHTPPTKQTKQRIHVIAFKVAAAYCHILGDEFNKLQKRTSLRQRVPEGLDNFLLGISVLHFARHHIQKLGEVDCAVTVGVNLHSRQSSFIRYSSV
jgi:hypothetical protein